ncbi:MULTISPECIES: HDOD domain-containing protein [Thalassotalea]|uniref:HDOD domain-containing protein n=1 Tax=Thalassotalea castellviae TaxID=3075612 RepID=A0ABU3A4D0_9GAMM|nr:HDOD domain-containing protein [Thalassotalea sp. W431]MDT0604655.1 HDOD domain-containing protein [Thalassotalea sp. W431]
MKVLLIDNKSKSLTHLNDLLKQQLCQTASVTDPLTGLKLLQKHNFDVVIVADNLEKTSVINLLKAITIKFPKLIRIAHIHEDIAQINHYAHYVFIPPVEPISVINTVLSFQGNHKKITKEIIVKSVAKVKALPSPPRVYMQLNAILKNANTDSDKIADIITQDPALAAKVIQSANNIFGQTDKPLSSIAEAITKLGVDTLSCIVMTAEMFSYQPDIPNFSLLDEQTHCLATARFAASLVSVELKQDTLLAGLLHDIGKLVLFEIDKALTLKYFANNARTSDAIELEEKIFSTDHTQIGAYLLHTWSFPYYLIDAVLKHHQPKELLNKEIGISQAVYLANCLLEEKDVDDAFLQHFNLVEKIDRLKQKALRFK